ncbi:hypothetical protein HMPREF9069_01690 [Atopobium sp. oral taxon 810 str. F0209]|nr:hypothetical protein HMPREF9069_01690 [Atopobium sp. oral taxon 810 str. F0209]
MAFGIWCEMECGFCRLMRNEVWRLTTDVKQNVAADSNKEEL